MKEGGQPDLGVKGGGGGGRPCRSRDTCRFRRVLVLLFPGTTRPQRPLRVLPVVDAVAIPPLLGADILEDICVKVDGVLIVLPTTPLIGNHGCLRQPILAVGCRCQWLGHIAKDVIDLLGKRTSYLRHQQLEGQTVGSKQ